MCFKWMEKKFKSMKWYEFSYLKGSVFFFTLFLVAVWPGFRNLVLSIAWYWYLLLFVIFTAPLFAKMFRK